jgi:uncharacterized protein
MLLSRFVVPYPDVREGEHVLYSVLEDRYVGIDDPTMEALQRWTRGVAPADAVERETCEVLLEDGFLVEDRAQDDARLREHLDRASEGESGTLFVTLMPTLQCNLACDYCFQKDHPASTKMTAVTEAATLEWVLRAIDERGLHTLKVHYFGGEPTTRKDFCLRTAEVLHAAMRARGGKFEWTMTTNGVLLDLAFARAMEKFGHGSYKVTLDGDKETHDRERVYRDGRGTFDVIFENVEKLARAGIRVRVGGNFLPHQGASFERLLDRIEASGIGKLLDGVRFKPIFQVQKKGAGSCTSCASSESETRTLVQLNKSVEKRKLAPSVAKDQMLESMLGPCELHWKHSYSIDPEGRIYKCPAVAGLPGLEVAQVASAEPERVPPLLELRPWEQCGDCPYLPVCVGGCLGARFLETGRRDQVACRKELFEKSFRETVIHRYLAEFNESPVDAAA